MQIQLYHCGFKHMVSTCLDPCKSLVVSGMKRNVYSDIRPSSTSVCSIRAEGQSTMIGMMNMNTPGCIYITDNDFNLTVYIIIFILLLITFFKFLCITSATVRSRHQNDQRQRAVPGAGLL